MAIIITNTTPTLPVTNIAVRAGAALAAEAAATATINSTKGNLQFGSAGDDSVTGSDKNDTMFGGAGQDVLDGGAGNDILNGGIGDDILIGGLGNDVLDGGDDNDVIWGDVQGSNETVAELMSKSDEQLRTLSDAAEAATRAAAETLSLKNASLDVATLLSNTKDRILGGSGDDLIFGGMGSDVISGGIGNDRIFAGAGDDVASGGTGNDSIYGEAGNDRISGDDGNDLLRGGDGNDTIWGGEGADTIGGDAGHDLVSAGNGNDTVQGGEGNDSLYGDAGDDSLDGNAGNDLLAGGLGNDVLRGGDGNDNLAGDVGNDSLYGDAGDDRLWGGAGDDLLDGGTGADMLSGDAGNDSMLGGAGNDWLDGGDGNDTMDGGADHDTLRGGNNNDSMSGGDGNDSMSGDAGNDVMLGGAGNDTMDGGAGKDELDAGFGDDLAIFVATQGMGDAGSGVFPTVAPAFDVYKGGEEPARSTEVDTLRVYITGDQAAANSHLFGYANGNINNLTDPVIVYDKNGQKVLEATEFERLQIFVDNIGVGGGGLGGTVNLFTAGADYVDFDNVNFSAFAGQASPNFYNALGGNDIVLMSSLTTTVPATYDPTTLLNAGAGDDRVFGRDRADKIDGGAGQDAIWGGASNDEIDGGDGNDTLFGGAGADIVKGGDGNDVIMTDTGHDANDVIIGGAGTDRLSVDSALAGVTVNAFAGDGKTLLSGIEVFTFGAGNDRLDLRTGGTYDVGSTISMGAGNDAVLGSAQRESIFGGLGNDDLQGGGGDDTISGEADNDRMLGEAGNDIMNGGAGNDTMSGGDNNDTLLADTGDDVANGEAGDDIVFGGTGRDFIGGGEGDDDLFGDNDGDAVAGDAGADFVSGGDGNDLLFGESVYGTPTSAASAVSAWQGLTLEQRLAFAEGGSNVLANSDTLMGETGNDTLVGQGGDDMLAGGSGNDWLFGGAGADVAYGDAENDSVYGGTGNDTLGGGDGEDVIDGGKGDDVLVYNQDGLWNQLFGSGGLSAYVATSGTLKDFGVLQAVGLSGSAAGGALGQSYGRTVDQFFGGDGIDKLLGTTGNDIISFLEIRQTGTTATETVRARSIELFEMGAGDDIVDLSGAVTVRGSLGGYGESETYGDDLEDDDVVLDMGTGNDIAFGSEADESMVGGAGHDRLSGGEGEDTLVGGDGAGTDTFWEVTFGNKTYNVSDVLSGGDDDDVIIGGLGIDFLHGGNGDDEFIFNTLNEGGDYVADFKRGDDTLVISRAGFGLGAGTEIGSGVSLVLSGGAVGIDPTFIYNAGNGELFFDLDGNGAGSATHVTTLVNLPISLSASDFDLV